MKKTLAALMVLTCSYSALAIEPAHSTAQFCANRKTNGFIKELALDSESRMAFQNQGGLANGGLCWWHSQFQRNALYLTIYASNKSIPTDREAKKIIDNIRAGKEIVEIPGFSNFYEFSSHFSEAILRELAKWQKGDAFIRQAWVKGLEGKSEVSADKMKELMDELYQDVEVKGNIAYQKLQLKGIVAHAWLVTKVKKDSDGYVLSVIDSNLPTTTETYNYSYGDTALEYRGYGRFTPYLEKTNEMEKIQKTISKSCN